MELGTKIDETTEVDISIISFYDKSIKDIDPDVASSNIDIHTLGASGRLDIKAYCQLRSILVDFDILHTHDNSIGSIGRIASIGTGVQVVNTEHNDHRHFSHSQNCVNCVSYPISDVIISNSKSTRDSFRFYERPFLLLSECETIYNGIDFRRIDRGLDRDDIPELPDGKRIITASTITQQKNVRALVEAMERVIQSSPEAELIIIGDGPLRPQIEKRSQELSIDSSTTFLGYLPEREQVYGTVAKCDIFVVPSHYEGFCNAAVEAMGCGLPVVASDIDVLHEVVGDVGQYANPDDPKEIADKILYLIQNENKRKEIGRSSRERARQRFPIERTVENHVEVYKDII